MGTSSRVVGEEAFGDDAFLCHHFSLVGGALGGKHFGTEELMSARGGDTACDVVRVALGNNVGRSVIDGLLLGISLILFNEFPDNLETADTLESPERLRECGAIKLVEL